MPVPLTEIRNELIDGLLHIAEIRYTVSYVDWRAVYGTAWEPAVAAPHIWVPKLTLPQAVAVGAAAAIIKNPVVSRRFWSPQHDANRNLAVDHRGGVPGLVSLDEEGDEAGVAGQAHATDADAADHARPTGIIAAEERAHDIEAFNLGRAGAERYQLWRQQRLDANLPGTNDADDAGQRSWRGWRLVRWGWRDRLLERQQLKQQQLVVEQLVER